MESNISDDKQTGNTVIFITSSELGRGSTELGAILMKNFMYALIENKELPRTILFINSGVQLACENSPVLEHLLNLRKQGVEILSCGTCLDYYQIKEKLRAGQVTNIYTILEKLNKAAKVISL